MNFLKFTLFLVWSALLLGLGYFLNSNFIKGSKVVSDNLDVNTTEIPERTLDKYSLDNLSKAEIKPGKIQLSNVLKEENEYTSYLFKFKFDPTLSGSPQKTVTGQVNLPADRQEFQIDKLPLVFMIRGFAPQETYQTGVGTKNAAAFFAKNGFMTIAPDFLGYGGSDKEAGLILETRFQTYTTVLSLIKSLDSLENWDKKNVFIWAHSNGGQITLTFLTITQANYPATLWAPVTKPFPYSILYYTDESRDKGKLIRSELANFESLYDVEQFSFDNYLDNISAPLLIHQGTDDDAVPASWSSSIVSLLKIRKKEVNYYVYPGADHNLRPSWDTVVERDLEFFRKHLK